MARLERKLDSAPERVVLADAAGIVVEKAQKSSVVARADEDPHAFDGNRLIGAIDLNPEDELHQIARRQVLSLTQGGYPERIRRGGVLDLAIVQTPAINLQVRLAHRLPHFVANASSRAQTARLPASSRRGQATISSIVRWQLRQTRRAESSAQVLRQGEGTSDMGPMLSRFGSDRQAQLSCVFHRTPLSAISQPARRSDSCAAVRERREVQG